MNPEELAALPENYLLASVIFAGAAKDDDEIFEKDAPAFGYTVKNRADYKNKGVRDVLLASGQYLEIGSKEQMKFFMSKTNPDALSAREMRLVKRSLQLAKAILEGTMEDPTGGADMVFKPSDEHYANLSKKFGADSVEAGNNYYEKLHESGAHEYYREKYKPYEKKKARASTKDIQSGLQALGYNTGEIDGKMGPITREAVIQFQIDNGLDVDGIPGKNTWGAMQDILSSSAVSTNE